MAGSAPIATERRDRQAPRRGWVELGVFGCVYLVYELLRGQAGHAAGQALANAEAVRGLQGEAAWAAEQALRGITAGAPALADALSVVYLAAQGVVVPAALVVLWRADRHAYRLLRSSVVVCWLVALPVYRLFPTAPPRLAGIGVTDTVSAGTPLDLDGPLARSFYNPYAAVPSLHVALALTVGAALWAASDRWWVRLGAVVWAAVVPVAVIATGNHYLFDVVSGMALGAVALALAAAAPALPAWVCRRRGARWIQPGSGSRAATQVTGCAEPPAATTPGDRRGAATSAPPRRPISRRPPGGRPGCSPR